MPTIGPYEILERLGAGGMGEVFKARDTRHGRTVAIKRIPHALVSDRSRRATFERDARAAAALSHPRIATLYELGDDDGQPYLVFEFVPGETLERAMAGQPLHPRRALDLAAQIADAIAEAHAAGVVHRDLCPGNVIITPRGHAKLLDCGMAAFTGGGARRAALATTPPPDGPPGTLVYASPEQALGETPDGRSDIFSLGVMLHEMLTGRTPFAGGTAASTLVNILQRTPDPPSRANPTVPREVDGVVRRALAKSLDRRYQSAAEMAADMRAVLAVLEAAADEGQTAVPVRDPRDGRPRRGLAMAAAIVLVTVAAAAWWVFTR